MHNAFSMMLHKKLKQMCRLRIEYNILSKSFNVNY